MIFFFYGEDAWRTKEKIDALKEKFRASVDPSGHNIQSLNDQDFTLESFFNLVKAQGFLASKKLIIIKNIFDHSNFNELQAEIIKWLETQKDTKDENYIVFWQQSKPKSNLKLFRHLLKYKYVQEFELQQGIALNKWIATTAKQLGCSIEASAINLLVALVGNDSWQLYQEIHKLSHQGQPVITENMVKTSVTAKAVDTIFEIIDACAQRNKARAHYLINEQIQSGREPLYLLAMLIRQFRLLARAHDVISQINNSYALSQTLDIHPFVAKKLLAQVRNFTDRQIKEVYQLLIDTDFRLKYKTRDTNAIFAFLIEKI